MSVSLDDDESVKMIGFVTLPPEVWAERIDDIYEGLRRVAKGSRVLNQRERERKKQQTQSLRE